MNENRLPYLIQRYTRGHCTPDEEAELMALLKKWQKETHDTVTLTAAQILPMDYDPSSFQRKPDVHQPEYILNRYFRNND